MSRVTGAEIRVDGAEGERIEVALDEIYLAFVDEVRTSSWGAIKARYR